jgi:RHS repeat-associated protein
MRLRWGRAFMRTGLVGLTLVLLALCLPSIASAAGCTDTWVGPAEGAWSNSANWSTGNVPGKAATACIGSGKTVGVSERGVEVGSIQAGGTVSISSGSLSIESTEEPSTVSALDLVQGELGGPGTLYIDQSLSWSGGGMVGAGSTVILPGAEADLAPGYTDYIIKRRLVNQGNLKDLSGVVMEEGAEIINEGVFTVNYEEYPAAIQRALGGGAAYFVNTGTLQKTSGTGPSAIEVIFQNKGGKVDAKTGTIAFNGGGSGSNGIWEASEEASVEFANGNRWGGTYSLQGGTWSGHIEVSTGSEQMTVQEVEAEAAFVTIDTGANGDLDVPEGSLTVGTLEMLSGILHGPGTVRVSKALLWTGFTTAIEQNGSIIVLPGAQGHISDRGAISEGQLINRGSLTISGEGRFDLYPGGEIVNEGVLSLNSEPHWPSIDDAAILHNDRFINDGELRKQSGTGASRIEVPFENRGGNINAEVGEIVIAHAINAEASEPTPHQLVCGDPVNCATGDFNETQTDFQIGGRGVGLDLTRTYSAQAAAHGATGIFGAGWSYSFGQRLTISESASTVTLTESSGATVPFLKTGPHYSAPSWSQDALEGSPETGFVLTLRNRTADRFSGAGVLESVIDRNGNETTLGYGGSGMLEVITDPSGRTIKFAYNGQGLVESAEDPMGHVVHYGYESGDLKSVTLPGEGAPTWRFGYDGFGRMTLMIDGRGGETINRYGESSRVVSQTDPAGRTTTWAYEPFHTTVTDEATGAITDERFDSNNQPLSITHGFGTAVATTETFEYTSAGLLAGKTDGNGHKTTYSYDSEGNRTGERDPEGDETTWTFDGAHQVVSETTPTGEMTTISRNSQGDPETISRPAPGGTSQTLSYEYGPDGEIDSMTDPLGATWSYGYDADGNRASEVDPEGDERTWSFDADSLATASTSPRGNEAGAEPAKFTTEIERDAQGRPLTIIDPLGGATKYAYDADGNIASVTDPNGHETRFSYDGDDEETEVEMPDGAVETTGYDGAGEVTSQINGDGDETKYVRNVLEEPVEDIDPLGRTTTKTFDAAGHLKTKTDPDGRTTTYVYDNADRLKGITYSAEPSQDVSYSYDEDGDLIGMEDATGQSTYQYDQLGRLIHTEDGGGQTDSWQWNRDDEPVGLTYPNGKSISRAYDEAGRLESVTDWLGRTTSFAYNRDSEPVTMIFPAVTGDIDHFSFDPADRMSGVEMTKGSEVLASLQYSRDPAGQLETLATDGLPGPAEEAFAYDDDERLIGAGSASFKYDDANNLIEAPGTSNAFDEASQIESATGETFAFDNEGERTEESPSTGPATTLGYDQDGELRSVKRTGEGEASGVQESFGYNGLGLLASRTTALNTKHLSWDISESPELLLSDGSNSYIYGPNGLPVEQISTGEVPTYLHHDQLGSTRVVTTASGSVAATLTFGPYGKLTGSTGAGSTALGYAGQYALEQSGLQYLRARFYDPGTAQFLTADPSSARTRLPFGYTGGNPINRRDPTGDASESGQGVYCLWCIPFLSPNQEQVETALEATEDVPETAAGDASALIHLIQSGSEEDEEEDADAEDEELCSRRYDGDQDAAIQLAKDARRRGGASLDDAETLLEWSEEYDVQPESHGPEEHPNRSGDVSRNPHFHIGPVDHIPIK